MMIRGVPDLLLRLVILLQFLFIAFPAGAQHPHPAFHPYTVEDGLPSSEVYQVRQDSKGYIWFATGNGVSRFNGYEFENFSMSNGLPDNTVFDIYEDGEERIWFVPVSCKLSYYYKGKIYPFKYNNALQKELNAPIKSSFAVDGNGTVFLGVSHDGIYKITTDGKITHYAENDRQNSLDVMEADRELIYATHSIDTTHKVRFNTSLLKKEIFIHDDLKHIAGIRMLRTMNHRLLLACDNNLYSFDSTGNFTLGKFPQRVIWLYEDRDSDLWIGTYLAGVYYLPKGDFGKSAVYLSSLPVNSVLEDRQGGYWFTTEGNGVFYSLSKKVMVYDENIGMGNDKVNCLATDGTYLYAGTQSGSVHTIKDSIVKSCSISRNNKNQSNIYAMYYDRPEKRLLISARPESGYIKNNRFTHNMELGSFNDIISINQKDYWVGTSTSLERITGKQRKFMDPDPRQHQRRINALLETKDHFILAGTLNGLWQFDPVTNTFSYLADKDTLLSNRILDLAAFGDGLIVIATKGKGVLLYNYKKVMAIDAKKGLCGDNVYHVFVHTPDIWVATNKGVNRITVTKKDPLAYTLTAYTTADGLSSNEINDVLFFDGKVWAASNKGINVFKDNAKPESDNKIPLYIDKFAVNDSLFPPSSHYLLNHFQNNILISFIALDYRNAGKTRYMYRMSGLDTTWSVTQNREIRFNTLVPGTYHFELRALDVKGDCKGTATIDFSIEAPFWQKWWFRLLAIVIVIVMITQVIRYRTSVIRQRALKNSELNKTLLALKLKALRAQMNPHFTFNVLNSIQHFILGKDDESAYRYLSKFSKLMRTILDNSENSTIPLAEEIKALELYMELEAMRFENQFEYEIRISSAIDATSVQIPSMLIQPYVENAIKHGILPLKGGGRIIITISRENSFLKCVVEDNGIGRIKAGRPNNSRGHRPMGTSLTKERLSVLNALNNSKLSEKIIDLMDADSKACGTRVEIYIPVG
jgi:ligand-binding sensor domain-containing protein